MSQTCGGVRCLCVGEIVVDVFPDGTETLGGAPLNVAVHVHRFGIPTRLVSAVGDDDHGRIALAFLKRTVGTQTVMVHRDLPTGRVDVRADDGGHAFVIRDHAAWQRLPWPPHTQSEEHRIVSVGNAEALVFGSLAMDSAHNKEAFFQWRQACRPQWTVCDINVRPNHFDEARAVFCLENANVLKLNEDELAVLGTMFGLPAEVDGAVAALADQFALRGVLLTLGPRGARVWWEGAWYCGDAVAAGAVVDTVGAGDAFTGAFLAALLAGRAIDDCLQRALLFAAQVCTVRGALPDADSGWYAL